MIHSRTIKGFGGTYVHQDQNNRIIGSSKPNPFMPKELFHYNSYDELCGRSTPDFGGGYIHYDAERTIIGKSVKNPLIKKSFTVLIFFLFPSDSDIIEVLT